MTKFNMTYGLYVGIGYVLVIMFFHLTGHLHYPGDQSGMVNTMLLGFAMVYVVKKYQQISNNPAPSYRTIFRISLQLGFFSSIILAFFMYWYYGFIAQGGISNVISIMEMALTESPAFDENQREMLMQMYREGLNAGTMAFTCGFSQIILAFFMALLMPFVLKLSGRFTNTTDNRPKQ